jgi:hypothetical protein
MLTLSYWLKSLANGAKAPNGKKSIKQTEYFGVNLAQLLPDKI